MSELYWFEVDGYPAVCENEVYLKYLQGKQLKAQNGHVRFEDGTPVADVLTGRDSTGYKNYNCFDLRCQNFTHRQDILLREAIRVIPLSHERCEICVKMHFYTGAYPGADVLTIGVLEKILQRAIGQMERVEVCKRGESD